MSVGNVACWFIGGPWNNRLVPISYETISRGIPIKVAVPLGAPLSDWDKPISFQDATHKTVDYHSMLPLETGTPVYSCLDGAAVNRGGHCFNLKSVYPRKL
jgi:hypothetical protein